MIQSYKEFHSGKDVMRWKSLKTAVMTLKLSLGRCCSPPPICQTQHNDSSMRTLPQIGPSNRNAVISCMCFSHSSPWKKKQHGWSIFLIASLIPFLPSFPFLSLYSISGFFDTMCQVWSEVGVGDIWWDAEKGRKDIKNDTKILKQWISFGLIHLII